MIPRHLIPLQTLPFLFMIESRIPKKKTSGDRDPGSTEGLLIIHTHTIDFGNFKSVSMASSRIRAKKTGE